MKTCLVTVWMEGRVVFERTVSGSNFTTCAARALREAHKSRPRMRVENVSVKLRKLASMRPGTVDAGGAEEIG